MTWQLWKIIPGIISIEYRLIYSGLDVVISFSLKFPIFTLAVKELSEKGIEQDFMGLNIQWIRTCKGTLKPEINLGSNQ